MTVEQNIQLLWEQTDFEFTGSVLCLMRIAHARFLSDNTVSDGPAKDCRTVAERNF